MTPGVCGLHAQGISSVRTPPSYVLAGGMIDKTSARVNWFWRHPAHGVTAPDLHIQTALRATEAGYCQVLGPQPS